jgi:hypothetical protein
VRLSWLLWPVYNRAERRPRALVRVLLQFALFVLFTLFVAPGYLGLPPILRGERRPAFRGVPGVYEVLPEQPEAAFSIAVFFALLALLATLSVALSARHLDRRSLDRFGLRLDALDLAFGVLLGGVLIGAVAVVEDASGLATFRLREASGPVPPWAFLPVTAFAYVAIGFYEELFSRAYQITNLAEGLGGPSGRATVGAVLLTSVAFGALHAGNPGASTVSSLNIVLAGFFLAAAYVTTGQLALPAGIHIGWNLAQNVLGMPVSGTTELHFGALLVREERGADLLTGGPFGPEAGLTGVSAMIAGTLLVLLWVRLRRGQLAILPLGCRE